MQEMTAMAFQKNPLKEAEPKPEPVDPPNEQPPAELPTDPIDRPNV
ncbi:hypothetical protein CtesDRAFT_PD2187 [Comamonas testosteroni KF-1]|uniref:Uncharacterized protein n=1 Tax=Comamonas testosteroni (strain DSM 14576 / KF-1) TaxID=399795 RepID=B7WRQ6_COMTK|nr:hypothetical protein CtesDRAFT_PD2187 [Comamonas testosteroni KF-1]